MRIKMPLMIQLCIPLLSMAAAAPDPEAVFLNPPPEAHAGMWWHWMGCNVTSNGIRQDLAWFKRVGVTSATIFGLSDVCSPWATDIPNSPTAGIVAYTPRWWAFVKFAAQEGRKLGIDIGVHNCPGYTATGGRWIPPELSMRELCFSSASIRSTGATVSVTVARPKVNPRAHAAFPVFNKDKQVLETPEIPARLTDIRDIAVLAFPEANSFDVKDVHNLTAAFDAKTGTVRADLPAGAWKILRICHTTMGSFTQPNQWEAFGLECDKMSEKAVRFHIGHVIDDLRANLGDQVGTGLRYVLLDSYEAGTPTWTPLLREEFTKRRGYDPIPYLPILANHSITNAIGKSFRADFDRTVKDLYRDSFRIISEELHKVGLALSAEPYTGPFDTRECAFYVDNLMTEFWSDRNARHGTPGPMGWDSWPVYNGQPRKIVAAESFTGTPENSMWDETPVLLKPTGDFQFCRGINRLFLHTGPLQPWDASIRPGMAMGRWGTHFGRTQTWAESGKAWFDYLARCQALLQWGLTAKSPRFTGLPAKIAWGARARADGDTYLCFVANLTEVASAASAVCPVKGPMPEWFDPVTGRISALARAEVKGSDTIVPLALAPHESGFLVFRAAAKTAGLPVAKRIQGATVQNLFTVSGRWSVRFAPSLGGPREPVAMDALADWTTSADPRVRYYSGTATYSIDFDAAAKLPADPLLLKLGAINNQIAAVKLNGRTLGTVWCEPNEVMIPAGLLKEKGNRLEIEFTNVWANRLIGDEQEPADCEWKKAPLAGGYYLAKFPDWFRDDKPRPSSNRVCFTTWNYFTRDSKLVPSGLLGPVTVAAVPSLIP